MWCVVNKMKCKKNLIVLEMELEIGMFVQKYAFYYFSKIIILFKCLVSLKHPQKSTKTFKVGKSIIIPKSFYVYTWKFKY